MAYETSILGLGCPSQTRGGYAAFKIKSRKKEGGASRKVVMNPRPRENPAQKSSGDKDCTCLKMLMRHLNSLEFYPAVVKRTYPELTIDLLICQQSKFIFLCRFSRVAPFFLDQN
jgi:hypothetical protein